MSNSEVFLVKGEQEGVESDILKRTQSQMPEFQSERRRESPEIADTLKKKKMKKEDDDCENAQVGSEKRHDTRLGLGEFDATTSDHDDDEEGFRTPTSFDHKIPEIKQCPPAPRKSKPPPSKKRKSSVARRRITLQSELSQELESLFPRPLLEDPQPVIKKARTVLAEDK